MDWVKKNWIVLVCGLVALAGIGIGVWSLSGFKQVQANANSIASIASQLKGMESEPANETTITEAAKYFKKTNEGTTAACDKALEVNKRTVLRDDVFPAEKKPDSSYLFRIAYRAEMQKLPALLNAGKAPNGTILEAIVHRMEDKYRKEAKLTGAGGELKVPKPPVVQPWVAATPARPSPMDRGGTGNNEPAYRGGNNEPAYRGGNDAESVYRGGGESTYRPNPVVPGVNPLAGHAQPAIPPREQLLADASRVAVYQTAKSIWTYLNDDSFEMHPIGRAESVDRPRIEDLWAAQVYLWLEQDVAKALRRANDQVAETLPEDQRWVAYLPVKHVVTMRISEYLSRGASPEAGRGGSGSVTLLRRGGGGSTAASSARMGTAAVSYTERAGSPEYDVVHFQLNLVVDARELPRILAELSKQNFFTPIQVQYRVVDVQTAQKNGYLYGSGPVVNVDIICEALFFRRSIFEPMMPQIVKDILEGKANQPQNF